MATTLSDCFSRTFAINLPDRTDRRKALFSELILHRIPINQRFILFPGVRPDSSDGFLNRGIRGCFLSHLNILRRAIGERLESILILEDDVMFSPMYPDRIASVERELLERPWGFVYLGHILDVDPSPDGSGLVPWKDTVQTAHCYGLHRSAIPAVVEFLESILKRPPGHPDGGPMSIDSALSFFRARHPEILTLVASPSLASQRPSRSDLSPRWFDRIPGLRGTAGWLRVFRNARRGA